MNVGVDHDTAQFAVNTIRRWLEAMGRRRYPDAQSLMITADCGGSNGARVRLWKLELQELADQNWRGQPLTSRRAIVELIAATTTTAGLTVACELDTHSYPKGRKVTDPEMKSLNIEGHTFHPEWNYTISPRTK